MKPKPVYMVLKPDNPTDVIYAAAHNKTEAMRRAAAIMYSDIKDPDYEAENIIADGVRWLKQKGYAARRVIITLEPGQ